MIREIITKKVKKSKIDIQAYYASVPVPKIITSQQSQISKQQTADQIVGTQLPQPSSQHIAEKNPISPQPFQQIKQKSNKTQFQLKALCIQGKNYTKSKEPMFLKLLKDDGKFQINYELDGIRHKLQSKRQNITGKRAKPNFSDGSIALSLKQLFILREDVRQSLIHNKRIWNGGLQAYGYTVTAWIKQQQDLKIFMETPLMDGLPDMTSTSRYVQPPKRFLEPNMENTEEDQDHPIVNLFLPNQTKYEQCYQIIQLINQMSQQEKLTVLFDVFKIRKVPEQQNSSVRKPKCPIHYCDKKSYKDFGQLKHHMKIKHPELAKHGIQLCQDGTFKIGYKAMDLSHFIGKIYPKQLKKIIKQMKTKQNE